MSTLVDDEGSLGNISEEVDAPSQQNIPTSSEGPEAPEELKEETGVDIRNPTPLVEDAMNGVQHLPDYMIH